MRLARIFFGCMFLGVLLIGFAAGHAYARDAWLFFWLHTILGLGASWQMAVALVTEFCRASQDE